ncbi:MAG: hypothetical protein U0793_20735 [Gemmataceae bacterium]
MGMDRKVIIGQAPSWEAWTKLAEERGCPVQMRMIDGELAFPDEAPPETWRELRVGLTGGMVTLQREPDGVRLVTWGNAGADLLRGWNTLAWALAQAGAGAVETEEGRLKPAEFAAMALQI